MSTTFAFQKGNLTQDGLPYGSGTSYSGVVDGEINDNNTTSTLTTTGSDTLGTSWTSSGNGHQYNGPISFDLTALNDFITANTGPYSSVTIQSVSLRFISAGYNKASTALYLYGTDPFTASGCTWANYTTATPWTVPYQTGTGQFGYTGGGSKLTGSLGGSNPNTGITAGNPLVWTSSAAFITAVQNALARTDKKLYLLVAGDISNWDHRLSVYFSPSTTVANRPQLTVTLLVTTTSPTATWTGASDTSWATANNWSPSGVPGSDAPIIFDSSSTANLNTVLNQDFTVLSLSVTNPSGPVSVSGANSLTIDTGGIDLSAATQDLTLSAPVVLGTDQAWDVAASRTLSVNGGISGSAALTVAGGGKVSLGAAASYTGDTTVAAGGTLQMGAANLLPNGAGVGNMSVGGTLDLNGYSETINGLSGGGLVDNTGAAAVTLTVGNASATFSGTIQNSGGALTLVKTGSGSETLNGANTYSGGTILNAGTITPGSGDAIGSGTLTVNGGTLYPVASMTFTNPMILNGGRLRIGGSASHLATYRGPVTVTADSSTSTDGGTAGITLSGSVDMGSGGYTLSAQGSQTTTISGPVSGSSGTLVVSSVNATLALSASNMFSGALRASAGTLSIQNVYAVQNATIDYNVADGGTINYNSLNCIIGALTGSRSFSFGPTLSIGNNNLSTNYDGGMSGGGSIIKVGTGTWTLTGANSYTGSTTVSAGTLALSGSASLASPTITVAGGATLDASALYSPLYLGYGQALANSGTGTAALNGFVDASYGNVTLAYASGTPSFQVNSGTLTLSSSTTFTINNTGAVLQPGTYTLIRANGGRVVASYLPAVAVMGYGAAGAPSLSVDGSGNLILTVLNNGWTGATDTSWMTPGNWASAAVPNWGDPINFNTSSTANLATVMNGDFSISTLTLTAPAGPVSIAPGGAYSLTIGGGMNLASAAQDLTITAPVVLGANQTWSVTNTHTLSVRGGVSGSAALTVSGGGKVSLGGAATYSGDTTVAAGGTLQMGAANVLPNGVSAGNVVANGTLDLNGTAQSINGLSGSGIVDNRAGSASVLTLGNNDVSASFNGTLQNSSGTLAMVKVGAGTLTLSGASTFSGGYTQNGGSVGSSGPVGTNYCFGTGPVVVNAGTIYMGSTNYTFTNALTLNGATLRQGGGGNRLLTWSGPVSVTADSLLQSDGSTAGLAIYGDVTLTNSATLSSTAGGSAHTVYGAISGNGNLTVNSGNLILDGICSYTGSTLLSSGLLRVEGIGAIPSGSPLTIKGSGNFNVRNTNGWVYHGTITGDGTGSINLNTGTTAELAGDISGLSAINVNNVGTDTTISGNISAVNAVNVQSGGGILRLSGTNSYYGNTTVASPGILFVNGDNSGATGNMTVNAGGTLAGAGSIGGAATVNGTLSPGNAGSAGVGSVGTLTFVNSLDLSGLTNGTGKLNFDLGATSASDKIVVAGTGTLTIGTGLLGFSDFVFTNVGGLQNGTYTLITSGAAINGTLNGSDLTGNIGTGVGTLQISGSGTDIELVVSGIINGPTLTSVTPNPVTGSDFPVTLGLTGSGFTGATAVLLTNLTAASGASYVPTVNSDTSISVSFVPGTAASSWNATVVNGTASAPVGFTVSSPPAVTISQSGLKSAGAGKVVLSGSGGTAGYSYTVLSATNLVSPVVWTPVVTNVFDGSGGFSYTNTVDSATPKLFLRLQQ